MKENNIYEEFQLISYKKIFYDLGKLGIDFTEEEIDKIENDLKESLNIDYDIDLKQFYDMGVSESKKISQK